MTQQTIRRDRGRSRQNANAIATHERNTKDTNKPHPQTTPTKHTHKQHTRTTLANDKHTDTPTQHHTHKHPQTPHTQTRTQTLSHTQLETHTHTQFDFAEALGIRHTFSKALPPWPLAGVVLRRGKRLVHWYTGFQARHEQPLPWSAGLSPPGGPPHFRGKAPIDANRHITLDDMSKACLQLLLYGVYHKPPSMPSYTYRHEDHFKQRVQTGKLLLGNHQTAHDVLHRRYHRSILGNRVSGPSGQR